MQKSKRGFSENVPHAYIQDGIRYYALMCEIETINREGNKLSAVNFYVFDQDGFVWFQAVHSMRAFINKLGNGLFRQRSVLEVSDTDWFTRPIVGSDTWINGSADRGYAVEIIRESLGLDFECLTALMEPDLEVD